MNNLSASEFLERINDGYADVRKIDRENKQPKSKHETSLFVDG